MLFTHGDLIYFCEIHLADLQYIAQKKETRNIY